MKDKNVPGTTDLTHWDEPHGWFSNAWIIYDDNNSESHPPLKSAGIRVGRRVSGPDGTKPGHKHVYRTEKG